MKIRKIFIPFFLLVGFLNASPMDHICEGCNPKYGQVAFDVQQFRDVNENATFHVAYYHPHGKILTWMDGEKKGLQEVYLGGELLTCSRTSEIAQDYFVHYYPKHRVASFENFQVIERIKPWKK